MARLLLHFQSCSALIQYIAKTVKPIQLVLIMDYYLIDLVFTRFFLTTHIVTTPLRINNYPFFQSEINARPKIISLVTEKTFLNLSAKLIPHHVHTVSSCNIPTEKILMHCKLKKFRNQPGKQLQGSRSMTVHPRVLGGNLRVFLDHRKYESVQVKRVPTVHQARVGS